MNRSFRCVIQMAMEHIIVLRGWPAELTFKGVVGTVLRKFIPKLNSRRLELFRETPFGIFIGMPTLNGDTMLCHLMMLHEVCDVLVARAERFRFELQGRVVEYGETEFCLISDLRFGSYVDLKGLIGRDTYVCFLSVVYELADNLYNWTRFAWGTFLWRYLRDQTNMGSVKMLKYTVTDFHIPLKVWILETFPEALRYAHHIANEFPRMRA
ncbi:unnamed protein product [Lactuca saligna]|uniref:Uncharacterized protein n=1 Tax=Lactuca saligna TaxID=75948 RepID=A0AA35Z6Y6_LACSI|nr:unnamed protein product [Lactuca saligna]